MLFICSSFMAIKGAESDPEKLQLSEHLFAAVLAEARVCCAGQLVILAGDFNADPIVIPSLAKGISDGQWLDLERAFAFGRGVPPSSTCQFQLDEDKGSRRDFLLACPIALAAATACSVLPDRWFTPHFAVYAEFALSAWMLLSKGLGLILPFGLLVGFNVLIVLGRLSLLRFNISGMFTIGKLVLFLTRFESIFSVCPTPLM